MLNKDIKNMELLSFERNSLPIINSPLVLRLINEQFPKFKDYLVKPILPGGWDNRVFRLGKNMLVRMPSAEQYVMQVEKEQQWLPKLAPLLPFSIPVPLAKGEPGEGYPWKWSIYSWLNGKTATSIQIKSLNILAMDLAHFIDALHKIDTTGGPMPKPHDFVHISGLAAYDNQMRQAIHILRDKIDSNIASEIWQKGLKTTWQYPLVWVHGDISSGNILVDKDKLCAIIDFGGLGIGDPACDLVIAWKFFDKKSRDIFRTKLHLDESTWSRGRAWALWKSLIIAAGIIKSNAVETAQIWYTINEVFKDYKYKHS